MPFQVGYYRRFVPQLVALKARIDAGELGTLSMLTLHQWDEHPPPAQFEASSGGIVIDMGVHEIDQLRWLTGQELVEVAAITPAAGDQSSAVVAVRLSGGTLGVITLGRRFPVPDSCWTEVVGTAGYQRLPFLWAADGEAVMLDAVTAELDAFARRTRGEAVAAPAATTRWRRWKPPSESTRLSPLGISPAPDTGASGRARPSARARRRPRRRCREPAVRSFTVCEASTCDGPATEPIRAPITTAMPPALPAIVSTSPVWTPARISMPSGFTASHDRARRT